MSKPESQASASSGVWGVMAEFDTPAAIMHAAERVREAGYRQWDCYTPFPVHGLDKTMGIKPTILPVAVFLAGLTGCTLGLILQWFTNGTAFDIWMIVPVRGYDFLISGKPLVSGPAWIPVIFESTILFAAVTTVALLLAFNRLPQHHHPTLRSDRFIRATDDRFFVVIEASDPQYSPEKVESLLQELEPLSIEVLED